MALVHIRFDGHTEGATSTPVPVTLYDSTFRRVASETVLLGVYNREPLRVMIREDAAKSDGARAVESRTATPGLFSLRAELPGGEMLQATVELLTDDQIKVAILIAKDRSPDESLSWAYAQAGVGFASHARPGSPIRSTGRREGATASQRFSFAPGVEEVPLTWIQPIFLATRFPTGMSMFEVIAEQKRAHFRRETGEPNVLSPEYLSALAPWLREIVHLNESFGASLFWSDVTHGGRDDTDLLRHISINSKASSQLPYVIHGAPVDALFPTFRRFSPDEIAVQYRVFALPSPMSPNTDLEIVLTVPDWEQEEGNATDRLIPWMRVLVRGGNPVASSVLSYLQRGNRVAARSVVSQLLDHPGVRFLQDPFSAVIAGYYLMLVGEEAAEDGPPAELSGWLDALQNGWYFLPDGAILSGVRKLYEEDYEGARESLLEAVRRGIPVYTMGLRMLFDSLSLLHDMEPEDKELERNLGWVRVVATYADWDSQTTSYML